MHIPSCEYFIVPINLISNMLNIFTSNHKSWHLLNNNIHTNTHTTQWVKSEYIAVGYNSKVLLSKWSRVIYFGWTLKYVNVI